MIGLYMGMTVSLGLWTILSIPHPESAGSLFFYIMTLILFLILGIRLDLRYKNKTSMYRCCMAVLLLSEAGASLAYRMQLFSGYDHSMAFLKDMIGCLAVFVVVWTVIRYTDLYRAKWLNLLLIAVLPFVFVGARYTKGPVYGSYLTLFGILVFAIVLAAYPFAAAYLLTRKERQHLFGTVRSLPLNLFAFLIYTFLLYAGCVLINEFGLLLVIGVTSTILFYIRSKNLRTKLIYTGLGAGGALMAASFISHIQKRVYIWLHLLEIGPDSDLAAEAETILYLFRNIHRAGIWGDGIGSVPPEIYRTLNNDHAMVAMLLEYSLVFAVLLIFLGVLLYKEMIRPYRAEQVYDYLLNLSCALILGTILLVDLGSCLGSTITSGIGYPFLSEGSSVNLMLTLLTAVHCGLWERRNGIDLSKKTGMYEDTEAQL